MDNLKDQVERGITTAYRKTIWRYFVCAVKEYQLIQPGDRVAVCVSGLTFTDKKEQSLAIIIVARLFRSQSRKASVVL